MWDEKVESEEEYYFDFCQRLRGVTSWTVEHEEMPVAPAKVNRRQIKPNKSPAKAIIEQASVILL